MASRPGSRASRAGSADVRLTANGSISEAAIAAGEAAIAAKRGPSPFTEYNRRSPSPRPRSPKGYDDRYETMNRWPSESFECSPINCNLSIGSFDWANGVMDAPQQPHNDSRHYDGGAQRRYPSPSLEMRYLPYRDERRHNHERSRYYDDRERYYESRYDRHHDGHYDHQSSSSNYHRRTEEKRTSQPLYSEDHILSTNTYEEKEKGYHRQSSNAFSNAPTPTAGNSRARDSVFRGLDERGFKSNVVTAFKDGEDPEVNVPVVKKEGKNMENKEKKNRSGARSTKKKETKKSKTALPSFDESPPTSPQKNTSPTTRNSYAPSPTNIDKELSAIGMDTLDGDYLDNLSFRKSYDLEQMFSFMKSPKSSMKEAAPNGGMMDLKFGSMSFSNSFLMSASGEEKDAEQISKHDLKMRSHHRHSSSFNHQHTSSLGLTPIHSFSGENNGSIVPLTSHDGMDLTAVFAGSPTTVPHGENGAPSRMMVHQQGLPPVYNGEYSYPGNHPATNMRNGPPPPSTTSLSVNTPPHGPLTPLMSVGPNKRILAPPVIDLRKRADLYVLLKRLAPAFVGFQFKLPEVDLPLTGCDNTHVPTDHQLTIAKRRVSSSICALGGNVPRRIVSFEADSELTPIQIKDKEEKEAYEKNLSSRYVMEEHCISWEVESHDVITPNKNAPKVSSSTERKEDSTSLYCAPVTPSTPNSQNLNDSNIAIGFREKGKKVKYRCKLCGQPKQNHSCPYQSTVMRSIGTMVYPAVNAFVSDEPGKLAPALSEMNNFTTLLSQDMSISTREYRSYNGFNVLTPDSHWSPNTPGALSSTLSSPSTPGNRKRDHLLMSRTMSVVSTPGGADGDALFRGTMELKPEQYRRVRSKPNCAKEDAFQYPHIPTPYSQRKKMGDTLFALSKEVPSLADSCAAILRSARENDQWDQAVAELTTQVLILLKCEEQDYSLEGLKTHLLTLGIAC